MIGPRSTFITRRPLEASARRFVSLPAYSTMLTSETVEVARIALRLPPLEVSVRLWIAQCDHAHSHSVVSPVMILSILLWLRTWMLKLSPTCRTLC
ncbi:hypothetical protein TNCV_4748931 [Trichonephila clavipes]|nr:hypothetical protein TNCV_4748931 [Trichonephila clavipes]